MSAVPEITMHIGQNSNGFEVKDVTPLEALWSVAYQLEHKQSGARLLHLYLLIFLILLETASLLMIQN